MAEFPHLAAAALPSGMTSGDLPADFAPLWLHVQPSGLTVELTQPEFLVGRHSECDLRLALPDVSRRHCRLIFAVRHWHIVDLNSLNGTQLNGRSVQEAALAHGDTLEIGSFRFTVDLHTGVATLHADDRSADQAAARVLGLSDMMPSFPAPRRKEQRQAS